MKIKKGISFISYFIVGILLFMAGSYLFYFNKDLIKKMDNFYKNKQTKTNKFYEDKNKICIIAKNMQLIEETIKDLKIKKYSIFNPSLLKCSSLKKCNIVLFLDYDLNNKEEEKCVLSTYNNIVSYEVVRNIKEDLVALPSSSQMTVNENVTPTPDCIYPFCVDYGRYEGNLYNPTCYVTLLETVNSHKPFLCKRDQNFIILFDYKTVLESNPLFLRRLIFNTY